jgi:hypothetical protein
MRKLAATIVLIFAAQANASIIEYDLNYSIADGLGHAQWFDSTFMFGLGDTLVFNILFDRRLQVFDLGDPSYEAFSFGVNIAPGTPGYSGTWVSSIEALGAIGDIWSGPITIGWRGGGAGFGWGGAGIQVTTSEGSFTGIRWTTRLTSASEGVPMELWAFTGVELRADEIRILPVPEPTSLVLFASGLLALGLIRRRVATPICSGPQSLRNLHFLEREQIGCA